MSSKDDKNYLGSGSVISKAIKKYGKHNFKKEIIEYCNTYEELCQREIYWIEYYKNLFGDNCYNLYSGGKGGDWKRWINEEKLKEVFLNIRKANDLKKGKYSSWNKGLKWDKDIIEKFKKSHTGKIQSQETIEKRRSKLIGKKRTKEQIKKQSESIKARYKEGFSEEHKKHLSDSHKGIKMSEEAKEKLRKSQPKVECPYCLKIGGLPIMKRYHFNNCKHK